MAYSEVGSEGTDCLDAISQVSEAGSGYMHCIIAPCKSLARCKLKALSGKLQIVRECLFAIYGVPTFAFSLDAGKKRYGASRGVFVRL